MVLQMLKTYDLIFSIGEACSCTAALRASGLQIASYPFDWLFGSDFIGRCKILASFFERFIEEQDLEYTYSERSISCDAYHNKYNDLTFNHDFLSGKDLSETYPLVKEKYDRRIHRLLSQINKSKKILVVYIETPVKNHIRVLNKDLVGGLEIIKHSFPDKDIDLLYCLNSADDYKVYKLADNITVFSTNYKSDNINDLDYVVNPFVLKKILVKNYRLNLPMKYKINKFILRKLINFIPIKHIRHKLRNKYHV